MMHTTTPISRSWSSRRSASRRGFTLAEVMVTLPLVLLLFGGTIALFLGSQRIVQRVSVTTQASQDAAVGQQYINSIARESIQFALPPDTAAANTNGMAFLAPDGNPNDYQTGGINTAVEFLLPAAAKFKAGNATVFGFNVLDRNGNVYPVPPGGYDRTVTQISNGIPINPPPGDIVCIYRGDASSTPAPGNGQYLWSVRCPAPKDYNNPANYETRKVCKFILTKHADSNPATDAVQFIGRYTSHTDIPGSMPYELEFKLVCGDQTAINKTQTNEAGDGTSVSTLVSKCALLRNRN